MRRSRQSRRDRDLVDLYDVEGKVSWAGDISSCSEQVIDKHLTIEMTPMARRLRDSNYYISR